MYTINAFISFVKMFFLLIIVFSFDFCVYLQYYNTEVLLMNAFERIDHWLNENHMSRRQLAIKAGIPPSTFQSAMERRNKMSDRMLRAIAPIMGTTVDSLITSDEVESPSGGRVRILDHPGSDFMALSIENLSLGEVLNFCRISRSGGLPESYLRSILSETIRCKVDQFDSPSLEEIIEKMIEISARTLQPSETEG